jgi:hypothetical protein
MTTRAADGAYVTPTVDFLLTVVVTLLLVASGLLVLVPA